MRVDPSRIVIVVGILEVKGVRCSLLTNSVLMKEPVAPESIKAETGSVVFLKIISRRSSGLLVSSDLTSETEESKVLIEVDSSLSFSTLQVEEKR